CDGQSPGGFSCNDQGPRLKASFSICGGESGVAGCSLICLPEMLTTLNLPSAAEASTSFEPGLSASVSTCPVLIGLASVVGASRVTAPLSCCTSVGTNPFQTRAGLAVYGKQT